MWSCPLSSQSRVSFTNPVPRGFVIIIISPLSCTCNFSLAAYLYTSCLAIYSILDRDILHLMSPLCFLIPSYNSLLLVLHGHSNTSLCSPGGALTRVHPVYSTESVFRCAVRASFHCSRSPLYRRCWMSRVTLLYIYSQHDLSGSFVVVLVFTRVGCHFYVSFVGIIYVVFSIIAGYYLEIVACSAVFYVCFRNYKTFWASSFALVELERLTYLSKISSSVSFPSSTIISSIVLPLLLVIGCVGVMILVASYPCVDALFTCICCRNFAHIDAPSMSSRSFNLFLVPST
jgi:hypothetical protein